MPSHFMIDGPAMLAIIAILIILSGFAISANRAIRKLKSDVIRLKRDFRLCGESLAANLNTIDGLAENSKRLEARVNGAKD